MARVVEPAATATARSYPCVPTLTPCNPQNIFTHSIRVPIRPVSRRVARLARALLLSSRGHNCLAITP